MKPNTQREIKGGVTAIAKWYPSNCPLGEIVEGSGAYYRNDNGKFFGEEFLAFLEKHSHEEFASESYFKGAGQPNPIRLEYESEDLPLLPTKVKKNMKKGEK